MKLDVRLTTIKLVVESRSGDHVRPADLNQILIPGNLSQIPKILPINSPVNTFP